MIKISYHFYYILIWGQKMYLFFEKSAYHKKYLFAALLQQKPWSADQLEQLVTSIMGAAGGVAQPQRSAQVVCGGTNGGVCAGD